MNLIDRVSKEPLLLKKFSSEELNELSEEIRQVIIKRVSIRGGHLSSNLGIIELTIALHRTFNIPPDKVIWDVGHQCYVHKILTGRLKDFESLRQYDGLTGYPCPEESITDIFKTGHAGTAISSSAGLKIGQDFQQDKSRVIAVIGDGSLTNGLTFEGLNFIGSHKKNVLIILNDNKMSISSTKGALSYYLTRVISSPLFNKPREEFVEMLKKIPSVGDDILQAARNLEKRTKYLLVPGVFFENLGLRYFGPIDGNDISQLLDILVNIKEIKEPVLLHVLTKKGKGYRFAEERPDDFHSAGSFDVKTGQFIKKRSLLQSPGNFAGKVLEKIAEKEKRLVVLTAAMEKGLGLEEFARKFPDRFFDVGIAEGHCIVFAAGLAKAGMKVVVAIYSTFLQRGYDQIFQDVCLQKLPVVFLVDRAGIVGEDGPTHHGDFDISFLRALPGLKIFTPCSLVSLEDLILRAIDEKTPCFIRYPKGELPEKLQAVEIPNSKAAVLACGSMARYSLEACQMLINEGLPLSCFPVDVVKPADSELLDKKVNSFDRIITVEENSVVGGFGSSILEYFNNKKEVFRIGLPDVFIEQGTRDVLLEKYGLTGKGIAEKIKRIMETW
jgi:1-deoxy-D-xylulose-5-phosphate synthase